MADDDEVTTIFQRLVDERGGERVLDTAALGVARALATALASPSPDARMIVALSELLPAKRSTGPNGRRFDLGNLSDDELAMLDHLEKVAHGDAPPSPPVPHAETPRERLGLDVGQYVDKLQDPNNPYHPSEITRDGILWLQGRLMQLVSPYRVLDFFQAEISENVTWPLRAKIKMLEDTLTAARLIDGTAEGTGQPTRQLPAPDPPASPAIQAAREAARAGRPVNLQPQAGEPEPWREHTPAYDGMYSTGGGSWR
jgi:hypothetical protein